MIVAATGHRPGKLGGHGHQVQCDLVDLGMRYVSAARPDMVISGMALGWDMAIAEAARNYQVPFIAAIPFYTQHAAWPKESQERYFNLLRQAHSVVIVCPGEYASWKMQRRNEWMVDHADRVVALWDCQQVSGGTANCVRYAERAGKPIDNLWDEWVKK